MSNAFAAPGDVDASYASVTPIGRIARYSAVGALEAGYPTGTGFNGDVKALVRQADGKMIVGGSFTSYNGTARNRIARLNADGTLDGTFDPGTGFDSTVNDVILDGTDVYVGGNFTSFNGTARNYIARLNSDGTLDGGFAPTGTGLDSSVNSLVLDGTDIYAGGSFSSFNGTSRNSIIRLNTDGTLDVGFDPGSGFSGLVYKIILAGADIYVGGAFQLFNGNPKAYIARLNNDGTIDNGFTLTGTGLNSSVQTMLLDGTDVYVAGSFVEYNGTSRGRLARLNSDGTLDAGFDTGISGLGGNPYSLVLSGTDIYVGGFFSYYNNSTLHNIVRLNSDGTVDAAFDASISAPDALVYALAIDGANVVAGGSFLGTSASGFNVSSVRAVLRQPDGKMIVGGDFSAYDGTTRNRIVRLNADGTLDNTFDPGTGFNGNVYALALDGTDIYVGGLFSAFNGTARGGIARLNSDGTLDGGFAPTGAGLNGNVFALAMDGTDVYVGGGFDQYNGTSRGRIVRLNTDGSLDAGFAPSGTGFDAVVWSLAVTGSDVVAGGQFTSFNGTSRNRIARLNSDGTLDNGFNPGNGFNSDVTALLMSNTDTDVYVGGLFTTYDGTTRNRIARLNADGSLDTGFAATGTGFNSAVQNLALSGTDLYVVGSFSTYSGTSRSGIARLDLDGALDTGFNPGSGFNGTARALAFDLTKLVVVGDFTSYNSAPRHYIAALNFGSPGFTRLTSPVTVAEQGASQTVGVVLDVQPAGNVVISVVASDLTEATVAPASLTFTQANWNVPQFITISPVDDVAVDGDQTSNITLSVVDAASSNEFDPLADQTIVVTTNDDDGGGGGGGGGQNNSIRVMSPNGGESLNAGQQNQITWQYGGSANHTITIGLSTDGGSSYTQVADIGGQDSGVYNWTVPDVNTGSAKIRVDFVQNGNAVVSDDSDASFTIVGTTPAPPAGGGGGGAGGGANPPTPPTTPTTGVFTPSASINEDYGIPTVSPSPCVSGSLIRTASLSSVYYCGANGKRYVFPNEKVYFSWYADFSGVTIVSAETMASVPLGGNVTYKPGTRMIKIESDPRVYVISRGGLLRWVPTEDIAQRLYGTAWNKKIDDVPVSFFPNYRMGTPVNASEIPQA